MAYGPKPLSPELRFWKHVTKGAENECWNWQGAKNQHGYGRLNVKGRPLYAHRISWGLHKGELAASVHVLHTCDNPSCVNPAHLKLGSQSANMQDCSNKGRNMFAVTFEQAASLREKFAQLPRHRSKMDFYAEAALLHNVSTRTIRYIVLEDRRTLA